MMAAKNFSDRERARGASIKRKLFIIACALFVLGAAAAGALYLAFPVQMSTIGGLSRNYLISWSAPPGTTTTELNAAYKGAGAVPSSPPAAAPSPNTTGGDWPSYNRTSDFGALLAAQPDQHEECRQAEGLVHLRRR